VIGKEVCEQDFIERDLSAIQGIFIRHRGLDMGVKWQDLNIELLGKKFPKLRYLHIEFGDQCDVSGLGVQPAVKDLTLLCPKLKQKKDFPQFQNAQQAEIQIPTKYLKSLVPLKVEKLELFRPKFVALDELPPRQQLAELRVVYARNLETLRGLEKFPELAKAAFCDCPNLVETGEVFEKSEIQDIWLSGVQKLRNIADLAKAKSLEKVRIIDPPKELVIPETIRDIFEDRAS
jgi:hypothetical protein